MINIKILIATVKREMGENIANCLKENGFTGITVVTGSDEILPCAGRENPGLAILAVSESQCRSLVNGMVDGALLLDSKGKVALINKAGEEALHLLGANRTNDGAIVSINTIRLEEMRREMVANKQGICFSKNECRWE